MNQANVLYKELLDFSAKGLREFTKNLLKFPGQLDFSDLNVACNREMLQKKEVIPRPQYVQYIPELGPTCQKCWRFYLQERHDMKLIYDVQLGKQFQEAIRKFLTRKGLRCVEGDVKDKTYPDNVVVDLDGNPQVYLEIKYQSAPWILAFKMEGCRECYEGSPALDIKKLKQQYALHEKDGVRIFYVYWLDFPCVKGVFYIPIDEMWSFYQGAEVFHRKVRKGDFKGGKVRAALRKIHPSVKMMKRFDELLGVLQEIQKPISQSNH